MKGGFGQRERGVFPRPFVIVRWGFKNTKRNNYIFKKATKINKIINNNPWVDSGREDVTQWHYDRCKLTAYFTTWPSQFYNLPYSFFFYLKLVSPTFVWTSWGFNITIIFIQTTPQIYLVGNFNFFLFFMFLDLVNLENIFLTNNLIFFLKIIFELCHPNKVDFKNSNIFLIYVC